MDINARDRYMVRGSEDWSTWEGTLPIEKDTGLPVLEESLDMGR